MSLQAQYPAITWLTATSATSSDFADYRPAIDANGQTIVFERTLFGSAQHGTPTTLYILIIAGGQPKPFLPDINGVLTRPDYCWNTCRIAFNNTSNQQTNVWAVGADGRGSSAIENTKGFFYPQWSADGQSLAVMSNKPCTTVIDTAGKIIYANINGNDANGTPVFAGMPAVNPMSPLTVAFAGQPQLTGWGSGKNDVSYNQDNNYIFCNSQFGGDFSSAPVESGAPIDHFDPAFQGRAPAWSPDGRYIVFESTRTDQKNMALYLFDTQSADNEQPNPVQLTDTCYDAQHAKFFPSGRQLIFCAKPDSGTGFRIASIDISQYVGA